ncbi:hypothetical protein IC620_09745 [Hazenella sp. IB182357]|uniref:Uncharacterized protein n=1 Tax=Polycladospora coralii TaxID=2771432 RepID=A0A926N9G7_9BACL|nr:hypothetical protein [Polycladospora coralii]MBD1372636.1 hypothetical protein [Polycladospora coralii]MBS7531256.1 hypothetical protein [Polycladospora coralii]
MFRTVSIRFIVSVNPVVDANSQFDSRYGISINGQTPTLDATYFNETNDLSYSKAIITQVIGETFKDISSETQEGLSPLFRSEDEGSLLP